MLSQEIWNQGQELEQFVAEMQSNQARMRTRINNIRLTPFERSLFRNLDRKIFMFVLTEDWCGDSLMNVPILAQLAHLSPNLDLRIFPRHRFPDIRAYYGERGYEHIPLVLFADEEWNEIGIWMERSKFAALRLKAWNAAQPEMTEITNNQNLSSEEKRNLLEPYLDQLKEEMEDWYDQGLQSSTVDEISVLLGLRSFTILLYC